MFICINLNILSNRMNAANSKRYIRQRKRCLSNNYTNSFDEFSMCLKRKTLFDNTSVKYAHDQAGSYWFQKRLRRVENGILQEGLQGADGVTHCICGWTKARHWDAEVWCGGGGGGRVADEEKEEGGEEEEEEGVEAKDGLGDQRLKVELVRKEADAIFRLWSMKF